MATVNLVALQKQSVRGPRLERSLTPSCMGDWSMVNFHRSLDDQKLPYASRRDHNLSRQSKDRLGHALIATENQSSGLFTNHQRVDLKIAHESLTSTRFRVVLHEACVFVRELLY